MTVKEFNEKYKNNLEEGHYGLDINHPSVIKYLNEKFEHLIKIPDFQFSQIKLKFGNVCFYNNLHILNPLYRSISREIENALEILIKYT